MLGYILYICIVYTWILSGVEDLYIKYSLGLEMRFKCQLIIKTKQKHFNSLFFSYLYGRVLAYQVLFFVLEILNLFSTQT